jgi:hypothetical protein
VTGREQHRFGGVSLRGKQRQRAKIKHDYIWHHSIENRLPLRIDSLQSGRVAGAGVVKNVGERAGFDNSTAAIRRLLGRREKLMALKKRRPMLRFAKGDRYDVAARGKPMCQRRQSAYVAQAAADFPCKKNLCHDRDTAEHSSAIIRAKKAVFVEKDTQAELQSVILPECEYAQILRIDSMQNYTTTKGDD